MKKIALHEIAPPSEAEFISRTLPAPPSSVGFKSEAEILQFVPVCRRTWWEWKSKGIIPYIKIGRKCLYDLESVRRALLRMQRGGEQ
jgi:hypothetical protein